MTEFLLRQLGATPEQIDRERERVRTELFRETAHHDPLLEGLAWLDNGAEPRAARQENVPGE
jgi:hypothetical protein